MIPVKQYTFDRLISMLIGKTVRFISDCEFFPNFDITGKVISYRLYSGELIFKVRIINKNKIIDIGSNMKNLQFEFK